jgi:hypothetical protein
MPSSTEACERPRLLDLTGSGTFAADVHALLRKVADLVDVADAVDLLAQASRSLGATSSCFISFVRDGDVGSACRMLLACDPRWGTEYLSQGWFHSDPWLEYALHAERPILASRLKGLSEAQRAMVSWSEGYGFRSVVIAPSPTVCGESRVGVLYVASDLVGYFDDEGFAEIRVFAQALSMELHAWWLQSLGHELADQARITEADLVLLRHEEQGHSSKRIAAELHTECTAIDSRFQRLNAKLGVRSRRAAVRLTKLYGLI